MANKTRPLHWQPPPTAQCDQCQGLGIVRGLFSSGPCAHCDGSGLVGEEGEPLSHDELVAIMRQRLNAAENCIDIARQQYRRLLNTPGVREAVKRERDRRSDAARGYGNGAYNGD
ncbi:hypothetical protein R84981_000420 [Carnimonas sp. R-84981]